MEENVIKNVELDIQAMLTFYLRRWWVIALISLMFGAVALGYSANFITPLYRTSITIYVNNRGGQALDYLSSADLNASQSLVNTYMSIVTSNTVMDKVTEELEILRKDAPEGTRKTFTPEYLAAMLETAQIKDTEIFRIYVTCDDPYEAADIANAVGDVAPEVLMEIIEGTSAKVIDKARVEENPYSPNITKNTSIGLALGVVVAVIILLAVFLLDTRIKDEDDLTIMFGLPILGRIPDFEKIGSLGKKAYKLPDIAVMEASELEEEEGAENESV